MDSLVTELTLPLLNETLLILFTEGPLPTLTTEIGVVDLLNEVYVPLYI